MLDLSKPVQTCTGRKVILYTTKAKGSRPIHGAVQYPGEDAICTWASEGKLYADGTHSGGDLVNVPETIESEVVVDVYQRDGKTFLCCHPCLEAAQALGHAQENFFARKVLKFTATKGEGVDEES